jgi:chemotaxis protein CheD
LRVLADPLTLDTRGTVGVTIGEIVASSDVRTALAIHGLGSCVGLSVWDPRTRTGALAHFMLPTGSAERPPAKFIASGLPRLITEFTAAGGSIRRAQVKAAGGAAVLALATGSTDIGQRNITALRSVLETLGLSLDAEDLGGTHARTIELSIATGLLSVRSAACLSVL